MQAEKFYFNIPTSLITGIEGDYSGLTDNEIKMVADFEAFCFELRDTHNGEFHVIEYGERNEFGLFDHPFTSMNCGDVTKITVIILLKQE